MKDRTELLEELSVLQIQYLRDALQQAKETGEPVPASIIESARKTLLDHGIQVSPSIDTSGTDDLDQLHGNLKFMDERDAS